MSTSTVTDKQVLFPDVTNVDVDVFAKSQLEYAILEQFGFFISTGGTVDADFYKAKVSLDPADANMVSDVSANPTKIFNALKTVQIGYLADVSGTGDIIENTADGNWEVASGLGADSTVTVQPNVDNKIGDQILNGIIGPLFTGVWGSSAVEESNRGLLVDATNSYVADPATGIALDHMIARGLGATLNNATADAHDEVLNHLVDQLIDANPGSYPENADEAITGTDASGGLTLQADGSTLENIYADQKFWMKVYLDLNLNQASSSNYLNLADDYQQDISGGGSFNPNNVLATDDDDSPLNDDGKANLVSKTLSTAITVADLNEDFLGVFKGSLKTHTGGSAGVFTGSSHTHDYSSTSTPTPGASEVVEVVRVPVLIRLDVDA